MSSETVFTGSLGVTTTTYGTRRGGADRREILERIVGEVLERRRRNDVIGRGVQQRVAVGLGGRDRLGADGGAGAGPVLDDHRLTQRRGQMVADQPSDDVDRRAGGERHDDLDRPVGVGLRLRFGRNE